MPSPINKVPEGLLDLLEIQQQGKNPNVLPDHLQPTLELGHLYATHDLQAFGITVAGQTVAALHNLIVPLGELWIPVTMSSLLVVSTAGQGNQVRMGLECPTSSVSVLSSVQVIVAETPPYDFTALAVGDVVSTSFTWPTAIAVPSDSRFVWSVSRENMAVDANTSCRLLFYRLRV